MCMIFSLSLAPSPSLFINLSSFRYACLPVNNALIFRYADICPPKNALCIVTKTHCVYEHGPPYH